MKTQVAPYETSALCLRIECTDGTTIRLTNYPVDLKMNNGDVYLSSSGYDFTGFNNNTSMSPSSVDLTGFVGFAGVSWLSISYGVFDNARAYLFAVDWQNPVVDYEPIAASLLGRTTLEDDKYVIEEMTLVDLLGQSVGRTYTAQCDKVFGGQEFAGCKFDVGAVTVVGTVTGVPGVRSIQDTGRAEAADYFAAGTIRFTTGANAGLKPLEIRSYAADGTVTTFDPFYFTPAIGDQYEMVPGCRKRLEDCRDKWDNVLNFGGFPDIPQSTEYGKYGTK